ncbi:MAG: DegV family protein [Clostridiales bacterium]|jgi:DegV family protein with EDD domain|nr:DegV family protein [Clostridiales bacterium]
MSKFWSDNCCDLTIEQQQQLDVSLVCLPYFLDGKQVPSNIGTGFDANDFYTKMENGAKSSTSALNPQEYTEAWEPILASGEDILYLGFSHSMSGTFSNMNMAVKELLQKYPERKITTIDTQQVSLGLGILLTLVATKRKEGAGDQDIVDFVQQIAPKFRTYATVEDLKYLKRGGRISGLTALVGGMLNIKPILKMVDGKLIRIDKVKGRKSSLKALVQCLESDCVDINYPIGISSAKSVDDAEQFKADILAKYPQAQVFNQTIGPVVGSHGGPGTIALFFVSK